MQRAILKGKNTLRSRLFLPLLAWTLCCPALADPLVLPAASSLGTNSLGTNTLVMPAHAQFLLRDLQTNVSELLPLLAVANASATNSTNAPRFNVLTPTSRDADSHTNNEQLIYSLGAVLENLHSDIQELLPQLAAMVGQTNYPGNPVATNKSAIPNHLESTNLNQTEPQKISWPPNASP